MCELHTFMYTNINHIKPGTTTPCSCARGSGAHTCCSRHHPLRKGFFFNRQDHTIIITITIRYLRTEIRGVVSSPPPLSRMTGYADGNQKIKSFPYQIQAFLVSTTVVRKENLQEHIFLMFAFITTFTIREAFLAFKVFAFKMDERADGNQNGRAGQHCLGATLDPCR